MNHKIYIISAVDKNFGIGIKNALPWSFKSDMKHFKEITSITKDPNKRNAVLMGRKTWESLPEKFRPLPNRINLILSRTKNLNEEIQKDPNPNTAILVSSFKEAFSILNDDIEDLFIIGGEGVYKQAINLDEIDGIYLTEIEKEYEVDTYFPEIPKKFHKKNLSKTEENGVILNFNIYLNLVH
jgi:dihydrofolate reductase